MQIFISILFALELALLFTHEMDAIDKREWKMFAVLKDMDDEKAYRAFILLHIPLYTAILFLLFSDYMTIGIYITDIFLIFHLFIHLLFKNHPANRLNNNLSKGIINTAGLIAVVHLILYTSLL